MNKFANVGKMMDRIREKYNKKFEKEDPSVDFQKGFMMAVRSIEDVPAADVVEVVRCKDCVNFLERVDSYGVLQSFCMRPIKSEDYSGTGYLIPLEVPVKEYDFCSYRKKRDKKEQ